MIVQISINGNYGQPECDRAALFAARQNFYLAAMLSGNLGYQGKAKTGPTHGAAAGFVYAEKWIKNFFLKFRRDTNSGVCYFN